MDVDASYMISIPNLEGTEKSRTVISCNATLVHTKDLAIEDSVKTLETVDELLLI